jgi:hypothetical protein
MRHLKVGSWLLAGAFALAACEDTPQPVAPRTPPRDLAPSLARSASGSNKVLSDQHVFVLNGGHNAVDISGDVVAAGGRIISSMDDIGVVLAKGLSGAAAARIARGKGKVVNDVKARWVPDLKLTVQKLPADATATFRPNSINEPETAFFYPVQWNMQITDTDDAWLQQYNGIPSVRVAILDTGLDSGHLDQFNLIDVASSTAFVPSLTGPPTWQDDHFHGTHVGGIVTSNNFGTAGVAPDVTLVAVKVLDATGEGTLGAVIAGIYHAANVRVDVINMSLGAYFEKNGSTAQLVAAFNRAVNYAHARDVFVVAAAGNDANDLQHDQNQIMVPCETGVLSCISATGPFDQPAYYTNYGTNAINNAAPGGDFTQGAPPFNGIGSLCNSRSAHPVIGPACAPDPTLPPPFNLFGIFYVWAEGTSAAAPHIAGLGAYLDSQYGGTLNGSQILTRIQQNADDLGKPGADPFFGKGRMNTCRTLPGCVPTPPPSNP